MFNDFLLLEICIILSLIFFFFLTDLFFFILNSVIFLLLIAFFLWLNDLDIIVNFLVIIDLGVFFVLICFLINFTHVFQNSININKTVFWKLFFIFSIFWIYFLPISVTDSFFSTVNWTVTFYNWFGIFNFTYFTDLQLLSDLYFIYTSLEFVLMNCYIYFALIGIFILLNLKNTSDIESNIHNAQLTSQNKSLFLRYQDVQKQVNQTATVRVWTKKKPQNWIWFKDEHGLN